MAVSGVQCRGNESSLTDCLHDKLLDCPGKRERERTVLERTDTLVLLMRNAVGWRMRRILGFDEKEEECRLTNEPQLCYIYMYISLRFLSSFLDRIMERICLLGNFLFNSNHETYLIIRI